MKIVFNNFNEVKFSTIHRGGTFIDPEYDESTVLMRVEPCGDVVLETDEEISGSYDGYAVDIQTGEVLGYCNNYKVVPVKAEIRVER